MALVSTIECDLCHTPVKDGQGRIIAVGVRVNRDDSSDIYLVPTLEEATYHICKTCACTIAHADLEIEKWINNELTKPPA